MTWKISVKEVPPKPKPYGYYLLAGLAIIGALIGRKIAKR